MELIFSPVVESYKIAYSLKTSALNAGTPLPGKLWAFFVEILRTFTALEEKLVGRLVGGSEG